MEETTLKSPTRPGINARASLRRRMNPASKPPSGGAAHSPGIYARAEVDARHPEAPTNPGLYLHIPFCSKICPYCDFAVLTGGPERRRRFADHLIQEISMWADERS